MTDPDATARQLLAEALDPAHIGEVAAVTAHELSNALNNLTLLVGVMGRKLPPEAAPHLAAIKDKAMAAAQTIRQFDRYRGDHRPAARRLDAAATLEAIAPLLPPPVTVTCEPGLPPVFATAGDLWRILSILVRQARAVSRDDAETVAICLTGRGDGVRITLGDRGPVPDDVEGLFAATDVSPRRGTVPLELAACRVTVRRWGGKLRAVPTAGGVEWQIDLEPPPTA